MKKYLPWLAAAALAVALVATNLPSSERGSSADRTAYSFVYALNHHNIGRVCSWVSDAVRARKCEPVDIAKVTREQVNADGSVRYTVESPFWWAPLYLTVVRHENGNWRVDRAE